MFVSLSCQHVWHYRYQAEDGLFSDLLGCTNGIADFFFSLWQYQLIWWICLIILVSHLEFFYILGKERLFVAFVNRKSFTKNIIILYHQFFLQKISGPPTTEYHLSQKNIILRMIRNIYFYFLKIKMKYYMKSQHS